MSVWPSKPKNGQGARHNQNSAISIPCMSRPFFHARKSPSKLLHIFRHSSPTASQDQGDTPNEWFHRKQAPPFARIPRPSSGISPFARPLPSKRTNLDLCSRLSWMPFTRRRACAVERVLWGRFPPNIRYIGTLNVRPASERERKALGAARTPSTVHGAVPAPSRPLRTLFGGPRWSLFRNGNPID